MDFLTSTETAQAWGEQGVPVRVGSDPQALLKILRMGQIEEVSLRKQLAVRLNGLIKERQLTQMAASMIIGIPQPHISELRHLKLTRFSSERLLRFITLLDHDVEIVIRPKSNNHMQGMVSVLVSAKAPPEVIAALG